MFGQTPLMPIQGPPPQFVTFAVPQRAGPPPGAYPTRVPPHGAYPGRPSAGGPPPPAFNPAAANPYPPLGRNMGGAGQAQAQAPPPYQAAAPGTGGGASAGAGGAGVGAGSAALRPGMGARGAMGGAPRAAGRAPSQADALAAELQAKLEAVQKEHPMPKPPTKFPRLKELGCVAACRGWCSC